MLALHRARVIDAISRTEDGEMGHSIFQQDMPGDEDNRIRVGSSQKSDRPDTWAASNLVALDHADKMLLQEFD